MADLSSFPITAKWPAADPSVIQLYSLPTPNGVKVSICLEEMGLAYEAHRISFDANKQFAPEFLALSPNNKIPAIIDPNGPGGQPIGMFESGAILLYLAEKTGQFLPADAAGRYEAIEWLMFQMAGIGPMFGQLGFFHKFAGKNYEDKRPLKRYVDEAKRLLGVLNKRLENRRWVLGANYSIVDMAIFPWVRNLIGFYEARDLVEFRNYEHVARVLDAFLARPAVARGLTIPSADLTPQEIETRISTAPTQIAKMPERVTREGRLARVEPLDSDRHGADLWSGGLADTSVWTYLGYGPFSSEGKFREWLETRDQMLDPMYFAVIDRGSGAALGCATLMEIRPAMGAIEIGHIFFSPALQRTPVATEAVYQLMRYVFDDLGYRRFEWKCDNANEASKRAALRFGFTPEGVFRQHMMVKGRNRDTAWFSILDTEWPALRAVFESWLAPDNFETDGRQRLSLRAMTAELRGRL